MLLIATTFTNILSGIAGCAIGLWIGSFIIMKFNNYNNDDNDDRDSND